MRLPHPLLLLSTALLTLAASPVSNLDLTIYAWPVLPSSTPSPLAQISYNPTTLNATLESWTPPTEPIDATTLLRIGLHDPQAPAEASWTGIATSASSLDPAYRKKLTLYADSEGRVWRVGFSAFARGSGEEEVLVEVQGRKEGPKPVLNRPVVLNKEGKVEGAKEEKTFLQK